MVIVKAHDFFKKIQFLGCYWAKRAKMAQNDKINLLRFLSQEPCTI